MASIALNAFYKSVHTAIKNVSFYPVFGFKSTQDRWPTARKFCRSLPQKV